MARNYDTVAFVYDRLARTVFGKAQVEAQLWLLKAVPAAATILIIGGGTGWILEALTKLHRAGLAITYVDASARMLAQSEKRAVGCNKVSFVLSAAEDVELNNEYDVVLTPFFFDNIGQEGVSGICEKISNHLKPGGKWLYCDFENAGKLWQRILLWSMYRFFGLMCGITTRTLPDMTGCFSKTM